METHTKKHTHTDVLNDAVIGLQQKISLKSPTQISLIHLFSRVNKTLKLECY